MKIFGINFTTKKELQERIDYLLEEIELLEETIEDLYEEFPFFIGQTVYDVALKNSKGRYTKTNPSIEHSTITPVEVTEKNYFKLVERFANDAVFEELAEAEEYLKSICK